MRLRQPANGRKAKTESWRGRLRAAYVRIEGPALQLFCDTRSGVPDLDANSSVCPARVQRDPADECVPHIPDGVAHQVKEQADEHPRTSRHLDWFIVLDRKIDLLLLRGRLQVLDTVIANDPSKIMPRRRARVRPALREAL